MLTFALLSTLLILSTICTVDDGLDSDSPSLTSTIIAKNIHGHDLYIEPVFYGDFVQPLQRRLLEHPRRAKQIYRSHDYHDYVAREYRPRSKLDESRSYRSSANDEDEDEDEEEDEEEKENQDDEENKLDDNSNDESADGETAEQNEEETVAIAARNRVGRSDYMVLGDEANERERREVRSTSEECEDEPTEPSQYYEYETELRNVASQDKHRAILLVKVIGASSLLILLFA